MQKHGLIPFHCISCPATSLILFNWGFSPYHPYLANNFQGHLAEQEELDSWLWTAGFELD